MVVNTPQLNIPFPDPSDRTSLQLQREILTLREILETRLDGMDRAMDTAERRALKQPTDIENAVGALSNVMQEKFKTINTRFIERDERVKQTGEDAKVAIKAALDAAKEAVGKTESNLTKELESMKQNAKAETDSIRLQINDLKGERSVSAGRTKGIDAAWGFMFIFAGLAINAVALFLKH